jgi:hypothetical protein
VTVPVQDPIISSQGNGITTLFPFPFAILESDDLVVLQNGATQSLGGQYSINGVGSPTGGSVQFISPPAQGSKIILYRSVALERDTDYQDNGDLLAQTVNADFDRIWQALQDRGAAEGRAVRYPVTEYTIDGTLPLAADRASTLFGFADNGMPAFLPIPAAVGAGDMKIEKWTDGIDFVSGTSNFVTLSRSYVSKANLGVVVMQGVAQAPDSYNIINGNQLQFDAAIPLGVSVIWCMGGTSLSLNTPAEQSVDDSKVAIGSKLMSRLLDFVSVRDHGCALDGVVDDSTQLLAMIAELGSRQCTLLISGPLFTSQSITFPPNVIVSFINDGAIVGKVGTELIQFQSQISAGRRQILKNCAFRATTPITIYPEWPGALPANADNQSAMQAAIDAIRFTGGVLDFDGQTYNIAANINISNGVGSTGQNTVLKGKGRNLTKINVTSAVAGGIQVVGASGSPLQGVSISDLSVTKSVASTGGVGIYAQYTSLLHIHDVTVNGFLQGVGAVRDGNLICERVVVILSGSANTQRGFNLDGGGIGAGGNASAVFHRCYVDGSQVDPASTGHIGFLAFGAYVSDLEFSSCETQMPYGIGMELDMSTSSNTGNEDVQIINCRFDSTNTYGLYINGAGQSGSADSMVTIIGGWINSRSTLAETDSIFLNNCRGISIIGTQFYCAAGAAFGTHVKMANCVNVLVNGCLFSEMKYGVYMTGSGYSAINGNRFYSSSGTPALNMIVGGGCSRVLTNGNVYDGYCNGSVVSFDNTSVGCGVTTSGFNAATLTNTPRVSNLSSGPVGGSDGSLGLNSGV